jgi:hypothetical protein
MTTMTSTTHQSIAHGIADLIASLGAERRAHAFWRDLATCAIHQLHEQRVELQRHQRQRARMAAELRDLRKPVEATLPEREKVAA